MACKRGEKKFTVVQVDSDPRDTHAARSFEAARRLANPDRGSHLTVWKVCAADAGEARLKRGRVTARHRVKR